MTVCFSRRDVCTSEFNHTRRRCIESATRSRLTDVDMPQVDPISCADDGTTGLLASSVDARVLVGS
jgi:hypothetical protein